MSAVPPGEPITTTAKVGAQIARAVWPAGQRVRDKIEAHREIGELVPRALKMTLCPSGSKDSSLSRAVDITSKRMQKVDLPEQPRKRARGSLKRVGRGIVDRLPGRKTPPVSAFGEQDFFDLLSRWIAEALTDDAVMAHIERIECPDQIDPHPGVIAARFPAAFFRVLYRETDDDSRYRQTLLESLRQADRNRTWATTRLDVFDRVLAGTVGAGVSAAVGAGAAELAGAPDKVTATVAVATAVTAFATSSGSSTWGAKRSHSRFGKQVRARVRDMLLEWAKAAAPEQGRSGDVVAAAATLADCWRGAETPDLAGRAARVAHLRDAAHQAGDDLLASALLQLGDVLHAGADAPPGALSAAIQYVGSLAADTA